jgi:hypothetical protein
MTDFADFLLDPHLANSRHRRPPDSGKGTSSTLDRRYGAGSCLGEADWR